MPASVYVDLKTRIAKGVNDGKPIVFLSRDNVTVKIPAIEEASTPKGTEDMSANEERIVEVDDDYFEQLSSIFDEAVKQGYAIEGNNQTFPPGSKTTNLIPVIPNSISRKNLNGTSDRYLNMIFTEE